MVEEYNKNSTNRKTSELFVCLFVFARTNGKVETQN